MKPYPINPFTNGRIGSEINLLGNVLANGSWAATWIQKPIFNNAFCAGHSLLPNGSILVIGGDNQSMADPDGSLYTIDGRRGRRIYDPCNAPACESQGGAWTDLPPMTSERWYPTLATLKDGSVIVVSGTTQNLDFDNLGPINNPTYEYWPMKTSGQWPRKLDILEWAFPHSLYPMVFQLPSGGVFLFVSNKTVIIDPDTENISFKVPDMPPMDHSPWIYPHTPQMTMLPLSKKNGYKSVLQVCGGVKLTSREASNMCWRINPDDPSPQWERGDDMPHARVMPDGVLLPDGKILYVNGAGFGMAGGNQGQVQYARDPVYSTDLFDPAAPPGQQWTTLAPASVARLYHSGALLTESGHVITVGSEMKNIGDYYPSIRQNCWPVMEQACTDAFEYRIERFTPPYLLTSNPRPVIAQAPSSLTHDSTFVIELSPGSNALSIDRLTFIRYTTTTHSTNTDQRFVELEILGREGTLVYSRMPPNGAIAPPGNWFLFALSKDGVPSVAKTVNLQLGPSTQIVIPPSAAKSSKNGALEDGFGKSAGWVWMWSSLILGLGWIGWF